MKKTDQKRLRGIITGMMLLVVAVIIVCSAGCTGDGAEAAIPTPDTPTNTAETEVTYTGSNVEKVELYHFHGDRSCTSCVVLGDFAEETVTEWYASDLESGRLVFGHINYDEPENSDLVEQYLPTGSSLWIGIYDDNGFYKQELVTPWYMLSDKNEYSQYLRAVIEQQRG
ncbi:nitrophenyl compound nitroreductase subunit ArsF family protein [Methanogenium marinum]|uniref:Nitrophenyl compound nitroreductase subunit ArsF family protein n=1 Tax=Methanogenium marinum TaxID=348610 RepID=A0A9Q4PY96_9EURY|nr:nitrophenyl compound nitroreductase subunit ArsF family protein [Methanogenium marinum]MDE4908248.1 nitrophenyl compound nitroreductase subunit ArsF family protein [Methanogenium marinum]